MSTASGRGEDPAAFRRQCRYAVHRHSCNADFNPARLERYLALANQAGTNPVILLTKVDATDDAKAYQQKAASPATRLGRRRRWRLIPVTPRLH